MADGGNSLEIKPADGGAITASITPSGDASVYSLLANSTGSESPNIGYHSLKIKGRRSDGQFNDEFFYAYHNSSTQQDAVNYNGRQTSDSNIATVKFVNDAVANSGGTPIGAIMIWMGASAPVGWFFLKGQSFSTTDYPKLHTYLQPTAEYTSGKLPDWRSHYPAQAGTDTSSINVNLGRKYGYKTALPVQNFKTVKSIPNGNKRTFTKSGGTNAYSDGEEQAIITGGDAVTMPKTVAVNYIIRHD